MKKSSARDMMIYKYRIDKHKKEVQRREGDKASSSVSEVTIQGIQDDTAQAVRAVGTTAQRAINSLQTSQLTRPADPVERGRQKVAEDYIQRKNEAQKKSEGNSSKPSEKAAPSVEHSKNTMHKSKFNGSSRSKDKVNIHRKRTVPDSSKQMQAAAHARQRGKSKMITDTLTAQSKSHFSFSKNLKSALTRKKVPIFSKQSVIAIICIGGVLVVVLGAVSSAVSSPYGIFYSSQDVTEDTMSVSAVQGRLQAQYNALIAEIQSTGTYNETVRHGDMPDFVDVIAVFAVRTTTRKDGLATDVVAIDEERAALIYEVFWDMCTITYETLVTEEETVNEYGETVMSEIRTLHIYTTTKNYEDMPDFYGFTKHQTGLLYEFMQERELLTELIGRGWYDGGAVSVEMTDEELYALAAYYGVTLPNNLSTERKNVLAAALAGVQINIPYHYDWRSYYKVFPGIEGNDFGSIVKADYKGRNRKGMDCSGWVCWAYYTAGITWSGFGYGESGGAYSFVATPGMRSAGSTTQIAADKLQPGDIGFISNSASGKSDHTGIFLGTTASGTRMWLHCAGSTGAICTSYNFGVFYTVAGMG